MSGMPILTTDRLAHVVTGLRYVRSRMSRSDFFEAFDMKHVDGSPLTEYEARQWELFRDDLASWLMRCDRDRLRKLTAWINEVAGEA